MFIAYLRSAFLISCFHRPSVCLSVKLAQNIPFREKLCSKFGCYIYQAKILRQRMGKSLIFTLKINKVMYSLSVTTIPSSVYIKQRELYIVLSTLETKDRNLTLTSNNLILYLPFKSNQCTVNQVWSLSSKGVMRH